MLNFEIASKSYAIPIDDVDDFLAIDKYEGVLDGSKCLYLSLETITGVYNVDYNGHFGSYIYLTIEEEHDIIETHKKISDLIETQLKLASEYVRNEADED